MREMRWAVFTMNGKKAYMAIYNIVAIQPHPNGGSLVYQARDSRLPWHVEEEADAIYAAMADA